MKKERVLSAKDMAIAYGSSACVVALLIAGGYAVDKIQRAIIRKRMLKNLEILQNEFIAIKHEKENETESA